MLVKHIDSWKMHPSWKKNNRQLKKNNNNSNKIKSQPTNPYFFWHVTVNTTKYFFFAWKTKDNLCEPKYHKLYHITLWPLLNITTMNTLKFWQWKSKNLIENEQWKRLKINLNKEPSTYFLILTAINRIFSIHYHNWSQVYRQLGLGKQCRHRSDCSWRSSLIRVYTVCNSVCIAPQ